MFRPDTRGVTAALAVPAMAAPTIAPADLGVAGQGGLGIPSLLARCARHGTAVSAPHPVRVGGRSIAVRLAIRQEPMAVLDRTLRAFAAKVDGHYEIEPHFHAISAAEPRAGGKDILRSPHAHRNDDGAVSGLSIELAETFLHHARQAEVAGPVLLLTGKLVGLPAMEAGGCGSRRAVTEDAEFCPCLRRLPPRAAAQVSSGRTARANLALSLAAGPGGARPGTAPVPPVPRGGPKGWPASGHTGARTRTSDIPRLTKEGST